MAGPPKYGACTHQLRGTPTIREMAYFNQSTTLAIRILTELPEVAVKVFDWGRAELNTVTEFAYLQPPEKERRRDVEGANDERLRTLGRQVGV